MNLATQSSIQDAQRRSRSQEIRSPPSQSGPTPSSPPRFVGLGPPHHVRSSASRSPEGSNSHYSPRASIVLVGFPGAGKQTLGAIAALRLRRRYVDFSDFFESRRGLAPRAYLMKHGLLEYREAEVEIVQAIFNEFPTDCVIGGLTCVGGNALREVLLRFGESHPLIYIQRDKAHFQGGLDTPEFTDEAFRNRDLFYRSCSNFDYFNLDVTDGPDDEPITAKTLKFKQAEIDFIGFLDRVFGRPQKLLHSTDPFSPSYTYALQVSLKWLGTHTLDYEQLDCGADMVTLVLDTGFQTICQLADGIGMQMAILRRHTRAPIMIHIPQHPSLGVSDHIRLAETCLRALPDFLSVPLTMELQKVRSLLSVCRITKLIGFYHFTTSWAEALGAARGSRIQQMAQQSSCHAVQISHVPSSISENLQCLHYAEMARQSWSLPLSAYNTGRLGRTSVCFNPVLTPVHPLGTNIDGITLPEAQAALYSSFMLPKKKFTIFGQSVSYSLSPAMHEAACRASGLPHSYGILQSDDFDSIHSLLQDDECGGVALSLPFKTKALPLLQGISPEAEVIGAVNTILVDIHRESGARRLVLRGHNTDHIGILNCIQKSISPANTIRPDSTALIFGAGGMARATIYACRTLGIQHFCIFNRTIEHARQLGRSLGTPDVEIHVFTSLEEPWPGHLRQPTVIVSTTPAHSIAGQIVRDLIIPDQWLQSQTGGVFIELAYKPLITRFIKQMRGLSNRGWIVVDGLDVLLHQGIAQFELFTGRPAPKHVMRRVLREQYELATQTTSRINSGSSQAETTAL